MRVLQKQRSEQEWFMLNACLVEDNRLCRTAEEIHVSCVEWPWNVLECLKHCNKVVQTHLLVPGKGEFQRRVQLKSSAPAVSVCTCEWSPRCKRISIFCFCNQMPPVYNCLQRIHMRPPVHHLLLYTGGYRRAGAFGWEVGDRAQLIACKALFHWGNFYGTEAIGESPLQEPPPKDKLQKGLCDLTNSQVLKSALKKLLGGAWNLLSTDWLNLEQDVTRNPAEQEH